MYTIKISVKDSPIDGKGVFADEQVRKGKIVWIFTKGHDLLLSADDY